MAVFTFDSLPSTGLATLMTAGNMIQVLFVCSIGFGIGACSPVGEVPKNSSAGSDLSGSSAAFKSARGVIQNHCSTCHQHTAFGGYTEAEFISLNYIVPGSPSASLLYKKLKGSNSGGDADMPQGAAALSPAELLLISEWISKTGQSDEGTSTGAGVARTRAAVAVLAATCIHCHDVAKSAASSDYLSVEVPAFSTFADDSDFVVAGLVEPGYPEESWIYRALKAYGDIGVMPREGAALTSADAAVLSDWITRMGED